MSNKQKIKNLTWKYFWEQKVTEVAKFLLIVIGSLVIIFLVSLLGRLWETSVPWGEPLCSGYGLWCILSYFLSGLMILLLLTIILLILGLIFWVIFIWLKSNYHEANQRAKKEVKQYGNRRKRN